MGKINIFKNLNKPILILTIVFSILGALLILDASSISATLTYGTSTPYYFFQRQLIFIGVSLVLSLILLKIPTKHYKLLSLLAITVFLILLLAAYGKSLIKSGVNEVTLSLFGGSLQPAEFLKVFLIVYMGAFYGTWANTKHNNWSFIIPLILCIISFLIIALGGDFESGRCSAPLGYCRWLREAGCPRCRRCAT